VSEEGKERMMSGGGGGDGDGTRATSGPCFAFSGVAGEDGEGAREDEVDEVEYGRGMTSERRSGLGLLAFSESRRRSDVTLLPRVMVDGARQMEFTLENGRISHLVCWQSSRAHMNDKDAC
jgi:hypothetical protein